MTKEIKCEGIVLTISPGGTSISINGKDLMELYPDMILVMLPTGETVTFDSILDYYSNHKCFIG